MRLGEQDHSLRLMCVCRSVWGLCCVDPSVPLSQQSLAPVPPPPSPPLPPSHFLQGIKCVTLDNPHTVEALLKRVLPDAEIKMDAGHVLFSRLGKLLDKNHALHGEQRMLARMTYRL
jgi:hypothetical protein